MGVGYDPIYMIYMIYDLYDPISSTSAWGWEREIAGKHFSPNVTQPLVQMWVGWEGKLAGKLVHGGRPEVLPVDPPQLADVEHGG